MTNTTISTGVVHKVHSELRSVLKSSADLRELWNGLTPLARNEWICWMTIAKGENTRAKRLERFQTDLRAGKRRPCCWPGCPHRRPNAEKWFK
ncbi:MAG: YdeI/OmpD-associated family protein [Candidatus Omnitrophica bacterium]|nr:YdeI/OmpD-associated family protein [Candidatus Omnitrophota bacterium]MCB9721888.1 YdeI/OmpD-associated family protein [Candidatus Omnitrophota bacterium]